MLIYRAYTISYFNDLILPPFAKIWHFCYALWAYVTTVSLTHAGTLSKLFSPLCSDTILVFLYQTAWQNSDGAPLMWASNARWYEKITISTNISLYLYSREGSTVLSTSFWLPLFSQIKIEPRGEVCCWWWCSCNIFWYCHFLLVRFGLNVGSRRRSAICAQSTSVNSSWTRRSYPIHSGRSSNPTGASSSAPLSSTSLRIPITRPSRPRRPAEAAPTRQRPRPRAVTPTTATTLLPTTPKLRHFRRKRLQHSARIFWSRARASCRLTTVVAVRRLIRSRVRYELRHCHFKAQYTVATRLNTRSQCWTVNFVAGNNLNI